MNLSDFFFGKTRESDHLSKAKAFMKNQQFSRAVEEYNMALETAPDPGEIIYLKSWTLQQQFLKNPENGNKPLFEALQSLTNEIDRRNNLKSGKSSLNLAVLYSEKGMVLKQLSQYEEAIKSFYKCLEIDSLYWIPYFQLHDLYKEIDRYPDAEKILDTAILEYRDVGRHMRERKVSTSTLHSVFIFRKYVFLLSMDRVDEAEKTKRNGNYTFDDPKYYNEYTICANALLNHHLLDIKKMADLASKVIHQILLYRGDTLTNTILIEAVFSQFFFNAVLEDFYDYLHMKDRRNVKAWSFAARALTALHKENSALEVIEGILAYYPQNSELHVIKGRSLIGLARYEEAIISFSSAIALNPTYKAAINCKGYALSKIGKFPDALALYDQSLSIDAKDRGAIYLKSSLLYTMYDVDRALQFLQSYLNSDPKNANIWTYGGKLLYRKKKFTDALIWYEKAYSCDKGIFGLLPQVHCLISLQRYTEADTLLQKFNKKVIQSLWKKPMENVTEESLKGFPHQMIELILDYMTLKGIVDQNFGKEHDLIKNYNNLSVIKKYINQNYPFIDLDNKFPRKELIYY